MNSLSSVSRRLNDIPLCWAGATHTQNYLNLGDALSPVMVNALSRRRITRLPMRSDNIRLSSTGSILHSYIGGDVHVWGSGMSPSFDPLTRQSTGWKLPPATKITCHALRGPHTAMVLEKGGMSLNTIPAYGDPVILLRRLYKPPTLPDSAKCELGVIIHLSETEGRSLDAGPTGIERYTLPSSLVGSIKFINTLTAIDPLSLERKIFEILSCKRIVSTSFHGLLLAELFGIPSLYLRNGSEGSHEASIDLMNSSSIDTRMLDFYLSLGVTSRHIYSSPISMPLRWDDLINYIDRAWSPVSISDQQLIESFPLDLQPIQDLDYSREDFFAHKEFQTIPFQGNPTVIKSNAIDRLPSEKIA